MADITADILGIMATHIMVTDIHTRITTIIRTPFPIIEVEETLTTTDRKRAEEPMTLQPEALIAVPRIRVG